MSDSKNIQDYRRLLEDLETNLNDQAFRCTLLRLIVQDFNLQQDKLITLVRCVRQLKKINFILT